MSAKKKILFIPRWYPDKNEPLHGIFMQRHARAVSPYCDIKVLYATSDDFHGKKLFYLTETENDGLKEIIYYYRKRITGLGLPDKIIKNFLYFYCMIAGYHHIRIKYGKPDLCHVNVMLRTGVFAFILKVLYGLRYVYTEHWGGYHPADGNYKGYRKLFYPFFISKSDFIMPVTLNLASVMQKSGIKGRYKQVSNVADTSLFVIRKTEKKDDFITAIHISNFDNHSKNITGLFKAVALVAAKRQDFRLKIVGYGPNEDYLKKCASDSGLLNRIVFFTGPKFGAEVAEELSESDFLVMFSHYENQPCVIAEAMSCGKPVLATSVGGIPEMVNSDCGLLTPPGNIDLMAENFERMLDTCSNYQSQVIRDIALANYSYDTAGRQINDIYQEVLTGD